MLYIFVHSPLFSPPVIEKSLYPPHSFSLFGRLFSVFLVPDEVNPFPNAKGIASYTLTSVKVLALPRAKTEGVVLYPQAFKKA